MKKSLLIAGASVLLLSGLAAGVFAKYQTTLDNVATGSVTAKQFVFTGAADYSDTKDFKLAPGESSTVTVTVKNFDASVTSEVAIDVVPTATFTGTLADKLTLTWTLDDKAYDMDAHTTISLESGKQVTKTLKCVVAWPVGDVADDDNDGNANDNGYIGTTATYNLKLVGTQHTA